MSKPDGEYWNPILKRSEEGIKAVTIDVAKLIGGVRQRLWFIFLCAAVCAAGGVWVSQTLSRTYLAEAVLLYTNPPGSGDSRGVTPHGVSVESVQEMILLPQNLEAVRISLGLDIDLGVLQRMVDTVHVRQSNLVRIFTQGDNPNLVLDLANAVAKVAADSSAQRYKEQAKVAHDYYKQELLSAQEKLDGIQKQIASFKESSQMIEMDLAARAAVDAALRFERDHQTAQLDEDDLQLEYQNLKAQVDTMPEQVVRYEYDQNPLKARIDAREMALLAARTRYGPQNPKVLMIQEELEQLRGAISQREQEGNRAEVHEKNFVKEQLGIELLRLKGKLSAATQRRESLEKAVAQAQKEFARVPSEQQEYARLARQAQTANVEIETLAESLRVAESAMETNRADVTIYRLAKQASTRTSMGTKYMPAFGFLIGGAFGLLLLLCHQLVDGRLATPGQLRRGYKIPHLLSVPEFARFKVERAEERMLFFSRLLADRIQQLPDGDAIRSVALTSSSAGEGKSTIAYHMARYYQRLGLKTLYIDFDSRPNRYLEADVELAPRLEKTLRGEVTPDRVVYKGKLHVAKMGSAVNVKELVKGAGMTAFWRYAQATYDRIVLDVPGIIEEDYAVNLLDFPDISLFVIGSSAVTQTQVDASLQELESRRKQPCGMILTRVPMAFIRDPRLRRATKGR